MSTFLYSTGTGTIIPPPPPAAAAAAAAAGSITFGTTYCWCTSVVTCTIK
jgi:hypothetical protein